MAKRIRNESILNEIEKDMKNQNYWSHLDLLLKFLNRLKTQYRPNAQKNIPDRTFDPSDHYVKFKEYDMSYSQLLWQEDLKNINFIVSKKGIFDVINFNEVIGLKRISNRVKDKINWEIVVQNPPQKHYILHTPFVVEKSINFKPMSVSLISSIQMDHRPPMSELIKLHNYKKQEAPKNKWKKIRKIHEDVSILIVDQKFNNENNHSLSRFVNENEVSPELKSILNRRTIQH